MLPLGLPGDNSKYVSLLVIKFPSAPKEGPKLTIPETLTLLPATSVSTNRPDLNHKDIGPVSYTHLTLPTICSV